MIRSLEKPDFFRAVNLIREKKYDKALKILDNLKTEDPDDMEVLKAIGQCYSGQAAWTRARDVVNKAHKLDPLEESVLVNLGQANIQLGDAEKAAEYWKAVLNINPKNINALQLLSNLKANKGDYRQAAKLLKQVLSASSDAESDYYEMLRYTQLLLLSDQENKARDALTKAKKGIEKATEQLKKQQKKKKLSEREEETIIYLLNGTDVHYFLQTYHLLRQKDYRAVRRTLTEFLEFWSGLDSKFSVQWDFNFLLKKVEKELPDKDLEMIVALHQLLQRKGDVSSFALRYASEKAVEKLLDVLKTEGEITLDKLKDGLVTGLSDIEKLTTQKIGVEAFFSVLA